MRLALVALLLTACAPDVAKDKPAATVSEAAPTPAAPPPAAPAAPTPAGAHAVDPARSKISALGAKVTGQHTIVFPSFTGELSPEKIAFTVQIADLQSEPEKLVAHLKSPDFFDVAQFPTASFASTSVTGEGTSKTVTGNLTLRGVTKEISFPATIEATPTEVKGHAEFAINRKDFGIVYPGKPDNLIQDNVVLTIDAVAAP